MKRSISTFAFAAIVFQSGLAVNAMASISNVQFDQLSWIGNTTSQPQSPWGNLTIDFSGMPSTQFLNLSIMRPGDTQPTWVIQNLGVASLMGLGSQTISTTFDLGISAPGQLVSMIDFGITLGAALDDGPALSSFGSGVDQVDYRIGGEIGFDMGDPARPPAPTAGDKKGPKYEGKLPGASQVDNQPQGKNECAPGAVSNSLNYLKKTGKIDKSVPSDMAAWKEVLGTNPDGTPVGWWTKKKEYLDSHPEFKVTTEIIEGGSSEETLKKIADAVKQGKDVEVRFKGHVAMVGGIRIYEDGRVEIDIWDDNQTDDKKDPMRTISGKIGGKIGGYEVDRFVTQIPSPSALCLLAAASPLGLRRRRR